MQHYSFFRLDGSLAAGEGVGSNLKPRDVEVIAIANMKIISMKGLVEKASGKVCQDDNNSVSYRKKDGKMFSMRRCHVRDLEKKPYTERELAVKNQFAEKAKIAAAWSRANRVYKTDSREIDLKASSEDYRKMRAAFDAQDKVSTFQAFVWNQIQDGAVVVPDITVGSSGSTAGSGSQTPSGGSSQAPSGSGSQTPSGGGSQNPSGSGSEPGNGSDSGAEGDGGGD